jgi:Transposase
MKAREQIWVGIDVGKAHHHACAVDETGKVVFSKRLVNGQAGFEALIARAGKAAVQVRWALDMTSGAAGLLLAVLRQADAQVVDVPAGWSTGWPARSRGKARATPRTRSRSSRRPGCAATWQRSQTPIRSSPSCRYWPPAAKT